MLCLFQEGFRNMFMEYGDVVRAVKMTSKFQDRDDTYGYVDSSDLIWYFLSTLSASILQSIQALS